MQVKLTGQLDALVLISFLKIGGMLVLGYRLSNLELLDKYEVNNCELILASLLFHF